MINSRHARCGSRSHGAGRTPVRPPDPTRIDLQPEALDFWARTLETHPEKIRRAVQKVGPTLERVKQELGIAGV